MCGRFTLRKPISVLVEEFEFWPQQIQSPLRYNIASASAVHVVVADQPTPRLEAKPWGLLPKWPKDARSGPPLCNARAETVATKPAFKNAFRERRGLMLADGFYEGRDTPQRKQPYFFSAGRRSAFRVRGDLGAAPRRGHDSIRGLTDDLGERAGRPGT
jgi:putative SOS response-associated peptidase YedK